MTAQLYNLHTHWRLTFEAPAAPRGEQGVSRIWIDAWRSSGPVPLYTAVSAAIRDRPDLRNCALTSAVRVRL